MSSRRERRWTRSCGNNPTVANGGVPFIFVADGGAAAAYSRLVDERTLTFQRDGERLTDVVAVNHFWFSWAAFKPETRMYQP
jgi:hypothetical protein